MTHLQAKLREELSGTDESLVVRVYGTRVIRKKAEELQKSMAGSRRQRLNIQYPGKILPSSWKWTSSGPDGMASPGDVRRAATSLVSGIEVGSLFEAQKVFEVVVYRHTRNPPQFDKPGKTC